MNSYESNRLKTPSNSYTQPVGFFAAYKAYWLNALNFKDRTSRAGYWWAQLMNYIILFVVMIVTISFRESLFEIPFFNYIAGYFPLMCILIIFFPNLSLTIRRLHDTGRRWPFILLGLIYIGGFIILALLMIPGSKYPPENKLGLLKQV